MVYSKSSVFNKLNFRCLWLFKRATNKYSLLGSPVHYKMFSHISGLYTVDASNISLPFNQTSWQPKMSPDIAKSPQGDKMAPSWESWLHGNSSHNYTVQYRCIAEMYRTLLDDSRIAKSFYCYNFNGNSFCILPSHIILNY